MGGQRERFPLRSVVALVPSSDPSAAPVMGPPLARRASPTAPVVSGPDWRALLHRGDSAAALAALREHPGGIMGAVSAAKSAEELLDLASVARFKGGDAAAAVRALERVVNELGGDPLAGLELSRLYEAQGRATEAQALRDKAMKGPMGELALADQIEADRRAGRLDEAKRRAKEYLERFPSGMHRAQLERLLDDDDKDAPKDAKDSKDSKDAKDSKDSKSPVEPPAPKGSGAPKVEPPAAPPAAPTK